MTSAIPCAGSCLNFGGHHGDPSFDDRSSAILLQYGPPLDRQNLDHPETAKIQASIRARYIYWHMVLQLAQIGCGYWGPNLLRAFSSMPRARLKFAVELRDNKTAQVFRAVELLRKERK